MRYLGLLSDGIAHVAAAAFFLVGLMLGYEVAARYFFNAPTIWAEELARLFMIWAVFLGSSTLIRNDGHIRVTVLVDLLGGNAKRILEFASLFFVLATAAFVAWFGTPIAADSLERGRTTGSMLDIPSWWMQASVPVGFGLIALQCAARSIHLATAARRHSSSSDPSQK